ncbi:hypothetical protein ACRARG_12650 [Pseudooceanicola sp. C21-150M6]|uniref:hypothetical protein n=1 Tax=Pseudooceanicola sp. C21-150M6 TaxID=3434355 RepID=UPI003D7F9337
MPVNYARIVREEHLPLAHYQVRIGQAENGLPFWSVWPEGPIGDHAPLMLLNGFLDDPEMLAMQLEAVAAKVRVFGREVAEE